MTATVPIPSTVSPHTGLEKHGTTHGAAAACAKSFPTGVHTPKSHCVPGDKPNKSANVAGCRFNPCGSPRVSLLGHTPPLRCGSGRLAPLLPPLLGPPPPPSPPPPPPGSQGYGLSKAPSHGSEQATSQGSPGSPGGLPPGMGTLLSMSPSVSIAPSGLFPT